jgi:hypothetical protein
MFRRLSRPAAVVCVLAGCVLAQGQPPRSKSRYDLEPFTAFPELRLVPRPPLPPPGASAEAREQYEREHRRAFEDLLKVKRLQAGFPRPTPADAPPLIKVRIAQVNEGTAYLMRIKEMLGVGRWTPQDFNDLVKVMNDVYRVAAELEKDPAEKVAILSEQVLMFKDVEWFTQARVEAGADPLHQLNTARFYRLQAEAELIQAKERLGVK